MRSVEWVDACLMELAGYAETGKDAVGRVRKVLGEMHTAREGEKPFRNKFIAEAVQTAFAALNRPTQWESFYNHDLPLVTTLDAEVAEVAVPVAKCRKPSTVISSSGFRESR